MEMNVYSIQDIKTSFMTPTIDQTDAAASRNFANAIMQGQGILFTHAEDFRLFRIGTFNLANGNLVPLAVPELVIDGSQVLLQIKSKE